MQNWFFFVWQQEYIFSFAYGEDGALEMELISDNKNGKRFSKTVTKVCIVLQFHMKTSVMTSLSLCTCFRILNMFCFGLQKRPVEMSKIKYQVCRLMRHLVSICRTLDKIPDDVSKR